MERRMALAVSGAVLAVGLVLAGCLSLMGRGVGGAWRCQVDLTDRVNAAFEARGMGRYMRTGGFSLPVDVTLTREGTYTAQVDRESWDQALELLEEEIWADLTAYVGREIVDRQGVEMTTQELLDALGMTMEDMVEIALEGSPDQLAARVARTGQYRVEDGRIFWSDSIDRPPDEGAGWSYTREGDSLTLEEPEGQSPGTLVFTKIS